MNEFILIVEDELKLAEILRDYLHQSQFQTHIIENGLDVIPWVKQHVPALILLDIMLPGKDGMTLCKELRSFTDIPIVMVTAKVEEIDRLLGLEFGADDYICKPYSPREVVARVKAVLRRFSREPQEITSDLVLDENKYKATLKGHDLDLTAIEFQLLQVMAKEPGRIFSRDLLMERAYRDHRIVSDRTIDSHIKKLRKKILQELPGDEFIQSVYGVGYKFEPPLT